MQRAQRLRRTDAVDVVEQGSVATEVTAATGGAARSSSDAPGPAAARPRGTRRGRHRRQAERGHGVAASGSPALPMTTSTSRSPSVTRAVHDAQVERTTSPAVSRCSANRRGRGCARHPSRQATYASADAVCRCGDPDPAGRPRQARASRTRARWLTETPRAGRLTTADRTQPERREPSGARDVRRAVATTTAYQATVSPGRTAFRSKNGARLRQPNCSTRANHCGPGTSASPVASTMTAVDARPTSSAPDRPEPRLAVPRRLVAPVRRARRSADQ